MIGLIYGGQCVQLGEQGVIVFVVELGIVGVGEGWEEEMVIVFVFVVQGMLEIVGVLVVDVVGVIRCDVGGVDCVEGCW